MKDQSEKGFPYEESALKASLTGWVCRTCGRFYGNDEHLARWCCATSLPCDCGGRHERGRTMCDKCGDTLRNRKLRKQLDKAETVEYDGNPFVVAGGEFYNSMDLYLEGVQCGEIDPQEWAFSTRQLSLDLSAAEIFENAMEAMCVDSEVIVPEGLDAFEKAVQAFNEANQELGWWEQDLSRKFRLPVVEVEDEE